MLNKRVATLLALVLVSSMALSGPAAVMAAASGNSGGTSQTETREDKDEKEDVKEKDDDVSADAEKNKKAKAKKNTSKNSVYAKQKDSESVNGAKEEDLPRAAEAEGEKESGVSTVSEPDSGSEKEPDKGYVLDQGSLIISSDIALELPKDVSGNVQNIRVVSEKGVSLSLNGAAVQALEVANGAGPVQIHLKGQNVLTDISINNAAQVTIDGSGILSANKVTASDPSRALAVISGGNIQTVFALQPVNGQKVPVYPISVNNLTEKPPYEIKNLKVGTENYSYGSEIQADGNGKAVMYLPAGKVQVSLNGVGYNGTVSSDGTGELKPDESSEPTGSPSPSATNTPTQAPSDPTKPPVTVTATPSGEQPDTANALNNKIFWINSEATYRSGANLQFYATGAGYNPEEPQQTNPVKNSTRYVPVSWSVVGNDNQSAASGKWKEKNREFAGGGTSSSNGQYVPAEYRFKGSFVISTNQASSVLYTLKVDYQQQKYNGKKWQKTNGAVNTQSVRFYIRNTDLGTVSPTPRSTYYSNRLTSTATRRDVSSNARNARTSDDTPIGTMIFLMFAAAGSGAVIFRRKNRS